MTRDYSRRCGLYALLALVASALIAPPGSCRTKATGAKASKASVAALSAEQVTAYVKEVLPLVEQAAGRKLQKVPPCKVVTGQQLIPVLTLELEPQMRALLPQLSEAQARATAESGARMYAKALVGKYSTGAGVLYVVPANLDPRMKAADVKPAHREAIIKLAIAHELTHALQDQQVGLAKLIRSAGNMEHSMAINATIEGQAMFVQDRVAESLGVSASEKEFARLIGLGRTGSVDPMSEIAGKLTTRITSDLYLGGRDFIAWHYRHGGSDEVWRIIASPPAKTSMIIRPETYGPAVVETVDYAALFKGIETRFGKRHWTVQNMEIGEMQLRAIYADMDSSVRDAALGKLERAQALAAVDGLAVANASVFVMADPSVLPSLISELERVCRTNLAKLGTSRTVRIEAAAYSRFGAMRSDASSKITFALKSGEMSLRNTFIRVVRGRVMLEFYMQDVPVSDANIAGIAEMLFAKLPPDMTASGK